MGSRFSSGKAAYGVAILLVVLLIVLAVFQHKWFGQLSERETERMKDNLRNGAFQFTMEVERELSRLQLLRNDDPALSRQELGTMLQQQLELWSSTTAYPALVENVFVVNDGMGRAWIQQGGHLVAVEYPPGDWSAPSADPESWGRIGPGPVRAILLRNDLRVCCIPNGPSPERETGGEQIVVALNRDYLVDSVFSKMMDTYLGSQRSSDLDIVLVQEHGGETDVVYASSKSAVSITADHADVTVPFFGGRPPGSPMPQGGSGPPLARGPRGPQGREMGDWPFGMRPAFELRIQHRAGSLEAAVRQNRLINLAIGSGILLLLLVGMGFILMTSRHAERLARQQIEFVAGISHELRTPLAVLQSVGDNLADGVVTDLSKARSYGKMVRTEVQRLRTMVENALAYAGIPSGKYASDLHPVDLRQVVRKACQSSQVLLEEQGVHLDVELPDALPLILGDAPSLQSVIENLLSNAMKYSEDHPWIGIEAAHDPEKSEVAIAVSDHGIGIARQEIPHLFDPFYRGREAMQRQIRGSGLGLNLAHHIVKRHGGTITVESTVGKGSSFVVHLPVNSKTEV